MNRKLFFAVVSVMLLAFFAVSSGCGGSSLSIPDSAKVTPDTPSNPDTPTNPDTPINPDTPSTSGSVVEKEVPLGVDTNNDNKPDVLDFDGVQQLYAKTDGTELSGAVPFMVWISSLPSQNSPDIITTELTAGTLYTFEVSKNLADPLGGTIPDVKIYDPSGNAVDAALTVYPKEQPSMILYTFRPSASGKYTVEVCNANENSDPDTETGTNCVLFVYREMQNSAGEYGYYTRFLISNISTANTDEEVVMAEATVPEIIQLRKNFIKAHPFYLDDVYGEQNDNGTRSRNNENGEDVTENLDGNITGEGEEQYGGYNGYMATLRRSAGIAQIDDPEAVDDGDVSASAILASGDVKSPDKKPITPTQIDATVYGVPYEDIYQLGVGFMATTNLQPYNESALEPISFDVPKMGDKTGTTRFTYSFISSKEDYEQKMGRNFSMGLTRSALGVSSSVQSTSNLKFGLTSTTLVIHYEELEQNYRQLPLKDYKLTADAMDIANNYGSETFREEYGDYFVAGYQYGGMYDAYVTITTETSDQLDKVKLQLGAKLRDVIKVGSGDKAKEMMRTSADMQFSQESQEILKKNKAQITVEIRTIGAGATSPKISNLPNSNDISAMGNLVGELTEFRNNLANSFNPNNYVPVNVMFRRYRSLSGMLRKIDPLIPVDAAHSANIMSFNRELVGMRGYYNVIGSLPSDRIDMSVRDEYTRKFDAIVNPIRTGGNNFYASAEKIEEALPKVRELSQELKAIGDRYTFYTMLMHAQEIEPTLRGSEVTARPFGENGGSSGYKSFGVSAAVTSDLNAGEEKKEEKVETVNIGNKEWYPELKAGDGFINCWIQVLCKNSHDNHRNVIDSPAVGKNVSKFYFQAGYDRDCDWHITYKTMRFNRNLYPFAGLK